MTPSTSTARIGRSVIPAAYCSTRPREVCKVPRRAEHEPTRTQGPQAPEEEGDDARSEVRPGAQEARVRAAAPWCLHPCRDGDAEEAELGSAQDRPCPAHQRDGGHDLHP